MMQNDDHFTPETVDEQVERILQPQTPVAEMASLNDKIIQELNATCKEDAALLERVWERYSAQINAQPAPISQIPTLQQEKEKHMHTIDDGHEIPPAPITDKPGRRTRSRLMTLANGFAAILIVSLLIIGSVVLFHTRHSTTPASPVAPVSAGKLLPPSQCSTLFLDPAEKSLCRAGQFNELDAQGSVGKYTVDVVAGYADPARIFLANKLTEKNAKGNYILNDIEILTVQGTDVYGGPAQLTNRAGAVIEGMNFDVSDINLPASIKSLDLTFKARIAAPAPNSITVTFSSPIILHFTLPFHPEKRAANLHVTTTLPNGEQVTLEHVLVTQSETIFTLQDYNPGGSTDLLGELAFPGGTLTIGATKISLNTTELGESVINPKQTLSGPRETVNIYLSVRLLDQHGEWVLSLPLRTPITEGSPSHPASVDTLVFHFIVP